MRTTGLRRASNTSWRSGHINTGRSLSHIYVARGHVMYSNPSAKNPDKWRRFINLQNRTANKTWDRMAILFFPLATQTNAGQDRLILGGFYTTSQSVGLLWASDRPVAENSTWQHTTITSIGPYTSTAIPADWNNKIFWVQRKSYV
jgi:hypothetical protein